VAGAHVKEKLRNAQVNCQNYAYEHGVDKPEIDQWTWPSVEASRDLIRQNSRPSGASPVHRVANDGAPIEEPRTCVRSTPGIAIACPPDTKSREESTAMAKIMGALITAIVVTLALLEWAASRM